MPEQIATRNGLIFIFICFALLFFGSVLIGFNLVASGDSQATKLLGMIMGLTSAGIVVYLINFVKEIFSE